MFMLVCTEKITGTFLLFATIVHFPLFVFTASTAAREQGKLRLTKQQLKLSSKI